MKLREAWYRYRPVTVRDGYGGATESVAGVTPVTMYGVMRIHDTEEVIIMQRHDDVIVGDLLRLRED
jgi:hypothetical protein